MSIRLEYLKPYNCFWYQLKLPEAIVAYIGLSLTSMN